jgi:hypothetical protein
MSRPKGASFRRTLFGGHFCSISEPLSAPGAACASEPYRFWTPLQLAHHLSITKAAAGKHHTSIINKNLDPRSIRVTHLPHSASNLYSFNRCAFRS